MDRWECIGNAWAGWEWVGTAWIGGNGWALHGQVGMGRQCRSRWEWVGTAWADGNGWAQGILAGRGNKWVGTEPFLRNAERWDW